MAEEHLAVGLHADHNNIFRALGKYIIHGHFATPQISVKDSGEFCKQKEMTEFF